MHVLQEFHLTFLSPGVALKKIELHLSGSMLPHTANN